MSEQKQPPQKPAVVIGRLVFDVAMYGAILLGVRAGLTALIPAGWCAGAPVNVFIYVLSAAFMMQSADGRNRRNIWPDWRLGITMLVGVSAAALTARLATGCTPASAWGEVGHAIVEALIMFGILIPLAHLHQNVIEPRWAPRRNGDAKR